VHLADWPQADPSARDRDLEDDMSLARAVVSLGRAARAESRIETRQPLPRALVLLPAGKSLEPAIVAEVADELNVKALETVQSLEGLLDYSVVPNFKTLGPRLGRRMPAVKDALSEVDGSTVQQALDRDGRYVLAADGEEIELGPEDVEVRARQHEELALARDGVLAVALDLRLDDALRREGAARKLVRSLNDRRKAIGLEIADRIEVRLAAPEPLAAALREHRDWIAGEVLAVRLDLDTTRDGEANLDASDTVEIDGTAVAVRIDRA
jgi:isoleucyl-tRNA synthetase